MTSEGEYYPLIAEAADGHDSVEWVATLPWSNGKVGTAGQSYHGTTQYLLPHTRPPHLVCQVPISASADFPRNPNTGHTLFTDAVLQTATQTIFHDAARASHIVLPLIPRS